VHGRSDATLNPGGVRLGTADYYSVVESIPGILDSLIIGRAVDGDDHVILFVKLRDDTELTKELTDQIRNEIRTRLSPKHVPHSVVSIPDIPYNLNFKKMEILIRRLVKGDDISAYTTTLQNPESLDGYRRWLIRQTKARL